MIKYRVKWGEIKAFEVLRETEKQVVLIYPGEKKERRENKVTTWDSWHDTWGAARDSMADEAEREVNRLRLRLSQANGRLVRIKGMKRPEGE